MKLARLLFILILLIPCSGRAVPNTEKIIDGTQVSENDYPYVARLLVSGQMFCTGTLVGNRHVLTAAHCFFDERNRQAIGDTDVTVRLGSQEFRSVSVRIHPTYRSRSGACVEGETDAALIELAESPSGVAAIGLYGAALPIGTELLLAGFGTQGSGSRGENGTVPPIGVVNIGRTVLEGYGDNPPRQNQNSTYFYWVFDQGEANTASGDSGGPAFADIGGTRYIAGITCGGGGNAEWGTDSFNTRGDLIKNWVESFAGTVAQDVPPSFGTVPTLTTSIGQSVSRSVLVFGSSPLSLTAENLPPGLQVSGLAIIGTPTQAGTWRVILRAQNGFGDASTEFDIVISAFNPNLRVRRALLQFDYRAGARDFLDLDGTIRVSRNFRPTRATATVQIGRFSKSFRLNSSGRSVGSGSSFFDLLGRMRGGVFQSSTLNFELTFERTSLFNELATLGFPATAQASQGDRIPLPLTIRLNGQESSTTVFLRFRESDERWVLTQ